MLGAERRRGALLREVAGVIHRETLVLLLSQGSLHTVCAGDASGIRLLSASQWLRKALNEYVPE